MSEDGKEMLSVIQEDLEKLLRTGYFEIIRPFDSDNAFYDVLYSLMVKLFSHLYTMLYIVNGILLENRTDVIYIHDKDSVLALFRTALENYWTFNSIFINPGDYSQKFLRCCIYAYVEMQHGIQKLENVSEMIKRANKNSPVFFLYDSDEQIDKNIDAMKKEAERLMSIIVNHESYSSLTAKQRKKVFARYPDWKVDGSWHDLAINAGFNQEFMAYMYFLSSSSVHSGLSSVISHKSGHPLDNSESKMISQSTIVYLCYMVSKSLLEYGLCSKEIHAFIKSKTEIVSLCRNYIEMAVRVEYFTPMEQLLSHYPEPSR